MESFPTLLEMEKMGAKIRDDHDQFKGAEFRDEKTKFLFSGTYTQKDVMRVWGTTFKPALYKECKRLGVEILDRVIVTNVLTKNGKQGARVVGATGVNVRTGEFIIVNAKAAVLGMARPERIWDFQSEYNGFSSLRGTCSGGGAIAWRAGAEFTMMEKSVQASIMFPAPTHGAGHPGNTWYGCSMVDANGKEFPWINRDGDILETVSERFYPAPGQKYVQGRSTNYEYMGHTPVSMMELLKKGEITLPVYADLPSMPEHERHAIWGLMVGQESKTAITLKTYTDAGFDPDKDMLQGYQWAVPYAYGLTQIGKRHPDYDFPFGSRNIRRLGPGTMGGIMHNWDLMTNIEGLYVAGDAAFGANGQPGACTTGKFAGRNAAEFVARINFIRIDRRQVEAEKARVYAPTKRIEGIDWKELNIGINKVMQVYCGEPRCEELLTMALVFLDDLKQEAGINLFASDPHKLGNCLEVQDILTAAEIVVHASLARKASSRFLNFKRSDYRKVDPEEWHKFVTIRQVDENVKVGEIPIGYWGSLEDNYEKHSRLKT
jgi:succinate dehydrogenase/fumarate reductase flavoprotein subunit